MSDIFLADESHLYVTAPSPPLAGIEQALRAGARLHSFLSGGGLRVVRLEKGGQLTGYGEAPHIEEALEQASRDFLAGHEPYKTVYLIGDTNTTSRLDAWIRAGNAMNCQYENDGQGFLCCLTGWSRALERIASVERGEDMLVAISKAVAAIEENEWKGYQQEQT